jgi:hypothetical protein
MGAQIWTLNQKVKAKFPTQDNRETFRGKFCRQGSFVTVPFFAPALVGLASWYSRLRALALIFIQLPPGAAAVLVDEFERQPPQGRIAASPLLIILHPRHFRCA